MIVVDTSGILASKDKNHPKHAAVAKVITDSNDELLLSPFVLAESDYMLATRLGQAAAREFLDEVATEAYELVDFDAGDVRSANGIIDRYADLQIGIADASLVAITARFETLRPLDRRRELRHQGPGRLPGPDLHRQAILPLRPRYVITDPSCSAPEPSSTPTGQIDRLAELRAAVRIILD